MKTPATIIRSAGMWIAPDGTMLPVISGADEPTEAQAKAPKVAAEFDLADLTDAQLTKIGEQRHAAIAESKTLADAQAAKAAYELVRSEVQRRIEAVQAEADATALQAEKADVAELPTIGAKAETEATTEAPAEQAHVETTETVEQPAAEQVETTAGDAAAQELVMAAAAKVLEGGVDVDQDDASKQAKNDDHRPRFASAMPFRSTGISGVAPGEETSIARVVSSLATRSPAETGPQILASARVEVDETRKLTRSGSHNEQVIAANLSELRERRRDEFSVDHAAKLAAICAPPTVLRDPRTAGSDATPVSDEFAWLTGESGNALAYEYREALSLSVVEDGVAVWTEADQAYIDPADPDTWKPTAVIECPDYTTVEAEELTASFEIDSWTDLSSPEVAGEFGTKISQLQARFRDGWVLRGLARFAHRLTYGAVTGAIPDVVAAIQFAKFYGTYAERLDDTDYTVILPPDLVKLLVVDDIRRGNHPDPVKSAEEILADIAHATGGRVIAARDFKLDADGTLPTNPYSAIATAGNGLTEANAAALPTSWVGGTQKFPIHIVDPTAFQPFTTGEATFGQQVTYDQARQNKRGLFMREFVGLMKPGVQPNFEVTLTVAPSGIRAGFNDSLTGA